MHDVLFVRGGESMRNLDRILGCLAYGQRRVFEPFAKSLAAQ
jgi:hypothetical protein